MHKINFIPQLFEISFYNTLSVQPILKNYTDLESDWLRPRLGRPRQAQAKRLNNLLPLKISSHMQKKQICYPNYFERHLNLKNVSV